MLLRSHGAGVLEQLIVLEEAQRVAAEKGLRVTQEDVDREYETALRDLTEPLVPANSQQFDREAAQRTLDVVLSDRNISREEFMLGMRRHAYLRAIATSEVTISDEQIKAEFELRYGPRVQVRHIQLATPREASRVRERLTAGENFADLAARYSANLGTARGGGLLAPFSVKDQDVPAALRDTASLLDVGGVSEAIRIGEWYHLIRLEERIAARDVDLESKRAALAASARARLTGPAMRRLYEHLFRDAEIEIHDPTLLEAFKKVHPNRADGEGGARGQ